ncbi:MAG: hypothetical protein GX335_07935 [Firmicutes bacterium]|nr:hypothetical protein [Bacillota bacterium]
MILTRRNIFLGTFAFLILAGLFVPSLGWAQADRVRIAADRLGAYHLETRIFEGEGNVEVSSGDLLVQADRLLWDLETSKLEFYGSVQLVQGDLEMDGESLSYDLETGEGVFHSVQAEMRLSKETGTVFFLGRDLTLEPDHFQISGAHLTTCDLKESHYHLEAEELEIEVGKKAIIRQVTYYEGKLPVFYWPYLVIPLDVRKEEQFFSLPVVGYGDEEGYYIRNTFNYYFNSKAYGHLYLDGFTALGLGFGARHFYDLNSFGRGSFYLYRLPHQTRQLWEAAWDHQAAKGNWELETDNYYQDSLKKREIDSQAKIIYSSSQAHGETWLEYKEDSSAKVKRFQELGALWQQRLGENWKLNLNGVFTQQETGEHLRLLDYLAETAYSRDRHTLVFAVQQQYNPDLLKSTTQRWHSVQRLPDLKWKYGAFNLGKRSLDSELVLGRYEEDPSGVQGGRILGQLNLGTSSWKGGKNLSFTSRGHWGGAAYPNQFQTWLYGRLGLNYQISPQLELTSTYSQQEVWGSTPFKFDQQNPLQDLSWRLTYRKTPWRASVRSGYNFKTKKFSSLILQGSWTPHPHWSFDLYGNYDLNSKQLARVVPLAEYKGDPLQVKAGGRYRFDQSSWEQLEGAIAFPLGETWQISYGGIYQPGKKVFTQGLLTVSKDLHCREISFSYDHVDQRVAFQYTIKAFPTLPIGWDSAKGVSLFDLEDISDIIGVKE